MTGLAVDILLVITQHWAISQTDRADLAGEAARVVFSSVNLDNTSFQSLSTPSTITQQLLT